MNTTKTGWIGLGKMGIPMCGQLIKAGYPVTVYNRNKDKEASLLAMGAATAATPAQLMAQCDLIFIMVTDDQAITDLFYGDDGLLSANVTGKIIINMSTVSPAISKQVATVCHEQGNPYLDAPVSGSVKQAEDGQLVIMAGGDALVFEQVKPVLEVMGKMAMHLGGTGAGNTAKLVINTLLGVTAQALAEAVVFAKQNEISADDLMTLLNNGALGSPFIKIKGNALISENYNAAFSLKNIVKDLGLATDIGMDTPLGQVAYQTFKKAGPEFGDEDLIAIIKQIEK